MLSRLAFRSGAQISNYLRPVAIVHTRKEIHQTKINDQSVLNIKEGPERDVVNFPHPVRPQQPGKVRLLFIPDEWFQFFYKKTGVTGPYMFCFGLWTYLLSKEIYVLEHEYVTGFSLAIIFGVCYKKLGPGLAKYLDQEADRYNSQFDEYEKTQKAALQEAIANEENEQKNAEAQKILFDAKRENIALQLEAAYRHRLMTTYTEVKKRLDYQLEVLNVRRRMEQKIMVDWIVSNVMKAITPQQEQEILKQCVSDLKALAGRAK